MKKILIIRFSSIGDIVLTTPVIRCLKKQLTDTKIHYLTKEQFYPVIKKNPYINKIHLLKDDMDALISDLKAEDFDHIIDLHKNIRSLLVKKKLRKPSSSFCKLNFKKWLIVNFKINRLPDLHIVDRYFGSVKSFNVTNDGKGLDYFIPEDEEVNINDLPENFRKGYICFVVGGKHATKILPEEKVISICNKIKKPVVLLGGFEDKKAGDNIQKQTGENVYNSCGKFSINQSASLVKKAEKIITNDTGLMHIATAFKKEIISVWGNTIPAFGMYPYLPEKEKNKSKIIEVKKLKCRPCGKIGFDKCPKKHFDCMNKIDVYKIIELANGDLYKTE